MFRDRKFLIAISLSIIFVVLIGVFRPREIDWSPTFSYTDKIPYGSYVLYNSLPDVFGKQDISINTRSPYSLLHKKEFYSTSLVYVQKNFTPTYKDCKDLFAFAAQGNNVFISAMHISRALADPLKISEKKALSEFVGDITYQDTSSFSQANFTNPKLHSDSAYLFKKQYGTAYYSLTDTSFSNDESAASDSIYDITVLGVDARHRPTFIRVAYGEGYIYIHNNPYAFSNYYLLKPRGPEYAARCLSYLPAGAVIWDEFYKNGAANTKTSLSFILSRESFRWAYYTSMVFLFIFILFNIKRRQRAIPIIEPFKNASLEFTKTIGSLYYNQANHKNIAQKKITYFLEFIRNRYHVDTLLLNEEFARKLCYKSGMSKDAVEHLLNVISGIENKTRISDTELIDLNYTIEYFKNNCQ
jgi:hypothetical protein